MGNSEVENLRPDDSPSLVQSALTAARHALAMWNIAGDATLRKRLENFTYQAGGSARQYMIRVTEPSHRSCDQLQAELDWLSFLHHHQIGVSMPIPSSSEALVETVDTAEGPLHVSVFEKAPGRPFDFDVDWQPEFHHRLGEVAGAMHAATRTYQRGDHIPSRGQWADRVREVGPFIPADETIARRELEVITEWTSGLAIAPDTYGLVHTDLNYGNLFVDDDGDLTVFDFDDCRHHWFAYDLAVPIFHALMSFDLPSRHPAEQDWFYGPMLEGYSTRMPITDEWLGRIPAFVRLMRIELFGLMHQVLDLDNLELWDRQAMQRMREDFEFQEPLT